jgi:hypothetical protein
MKDIEAKMCPLSQAVYYLSPSLTEKLESFSLIKVGCGALIRRELQSIETPMVL